MLLLALVEGFVLQTVRLAFRVHRCLPLLLTLLAERLVRVQALTARLLQLLDLILNRRFFTVSGGLRRAAQLFHLLLHLLALEHFFDGCSHIPKLLHILLGRVLDSRIL